MIRTRRKISSNSLPQYTLTFEQLRHRLRLGQHYQNHEENGEEDDKAKLFWRKLDPFDEDEPELIGGVRFHGCPCKYCVTGLLDEAEADREMEALYKWMQEQEGQAAQPRQQDSIVTSQDADVHAQDPTEAYLQQNDDDDDANGDVADLDKEEDQMEVIEIDDDSDEDNEQVDDDEMADEEDDDNEPDKSSSGEELTRPSTSRSSSNPTRLANGAFVCSYCNKAVTTKRSLEAHIRSHTGEKPYVCQFEGCNEAFKRKENLTVHFKMQHSEILELKVCQQCGKSFKYLSNLTVHLKRHSGEMPFKCRFPGCNMGYKSYYKLKKHLKSHQS